VRVARRAFVAYTEIVRRFIVLAALAGCAAAPQVPVIAHRPPAATFGTPCRVHGRAVDATTGEDVGGATIVPLVGDAVLSDEHGAFEVELRGTRVVRVYLYDAAVTRDLADVPCGGSVVLHVRFSETYLHRGSCVPYPDVIGID
jgi:hypothetical protein